MHDFYVCFIAVVVVYSLLVLYLDSEYFNIKILNCNPPKTGKPPPAFITSGWTEIRTHMYATIKINDVNTTQQWGFASLK